jgi:hypothetical protein
MAESVSLSTTQPSVHNVISKDGLFPTRVSGRDDAASDLSVVSIVVGKAASAPAVFSDFTTGTTLTVRATSASAVSWNIAGVTQSYGLTFMAGLPGSVSVGDSVYVALFNFAAPAGSNPVAAIAGPFDVVA